MASKFKKKLKKIGKVAALAAAAYGASKLGRRRATHAPGNAAAAAKKLLTSNRAYTGRGYDDPIMTGGVGVKHSKIDPYPDRDWSGNEMWMKKGGRVKSMGIAKRGGGVAKR